MKPTINITVGNLSEAIFCIQQILASELTYADPIFPPKKRKSPPNKKRGKNT